MTNWKPIESAPKDGTPVLLWARLASVPLRVQSNRWLLARVSRRAMESSARTFERRRLGREVLDRASPSSLRAALSPEAPKWRPPL